MRRDAVYGTALIIGAFAGLITMAMHPTGHQLIADVRGTTPLVVATHALALIGAPISFFGVLGLTRRLWDGDHEIAIAALVAYGFGSVAVMCAAVASGFIAPDLARMLSEGGANRQALEAVWGYNGHLNQAFARVFVVASSVAILLWSIAILTSRLLARGAGLLGFLIAVLTLVALLSGHLSLNVHGFGLVVLGQSAWMVVVGILLIRAVPLTPRAASA